MKQLALECLVGILVGIVIGIVISNYTIEQEAKNRDDSIIIALKAELLVNEDILKKDKEIIESDIKVHSQRRLVVAPLSLINNSWDLIKFNLPKRLIEDQKLLALFRKISLLTYETNSFIISRENYRLNNEAMTNFHTRMKIYDELILNQISTLLIAIEEIRALL